MRIPEVQSRDQLPEDQRAVWDNIRATRGRVGGLFKAILHSPELASRMTAVGTYIRFESKMPVRVRVLAALTTVHILNCEYEKSAQRVSARQNGISDEIVAAIAEGRGSDIPPDDRWVYELVHQLLTEHTVDEAKIEDAKRRLNLNDLIELLGAIGYYSMIACTLVALDIAPNPT